VRDACPVRGAQRGEDTQADLGRPSRAERPFLLNQVTQRPVGEKLHDDPRTAVFLDDVENPHHVPVTEPGGKPSLPDSAAAGRLPFLPGKVRRPDQLLHRHLTVKQPIAGPPHNAHATTADDRAEPVSSGDKATWLN